MREVERIYARFIWNLLREKEQGGLTGPVERCRQEDLMPVNFRSSVQPGKRLRPGERQKWRKVTRLYPFVDTVPSAEEIAYYQTLGEYALAADRQSDGKELGRLDATGQWGRFRAVQSLATMHRYYLPDPVENLGRAEGQPMFTYDKRHYFVDGEGKDASGLAGHPRVRPELWRLAKYVEVLGHLDCAPQAVLIGSEERWFRDTNQFRMWFEALKRFNVKLFVGGMGEVTEQNCSLICMRVEALSAWLGPRSKNARIAKRGRGEAYNGVLTFALDYPVDETGRKIKSRCLVIPDKWQTMRELAYLVAQEEINSAAEAAAWLYAEHKRLGRPPQDRPCSVAFVRKWFNSTVPEGRYPCHTCETSACRLQLDGTMITDLDVTDNGVIRRYVEKCDPIHLPIEIPAELAIPADILAHVRARLLGRKPRRKKEIWVENLTPLFPSHLVRCAHCDTYIVERPPRQGKPRQYQESRQRDDELLVWLHAEGKTYQQIARHLQEQLQQETGRETPVSKSRVHKRLQLLGINSRSVEEGLRKVAAFWGDPFRRRNGDWHLYCHCSSVLALKHDPSEEERERLDPNGHVIKRAGSLTLAAWPKIWQACMNHPPTQDEPEETTDEATAAAERAELSRQVERLQTEIDAVNQEWWKGEFGDRQSEEAKRQRDSLKKPMEDEKVSKIARRDGLAAQIIEQKRDKITSADFAAIRERMRDLDENDPSPEWRQEFIRTFVKRVTVNLATGEWVMDLHFDWEDLRRLVGKLGVPTADLVPPAPHSLCVADISGGTTTRYRSPWDFSTTARGRLILG
jgi:hypothetical protein